MITSAIQDATHALNPSRSVSGNQFRCCVETISIHLPDSDWLHAQFRVLSNPANTDAAKRELLPLSHTALLRPHEPERTWEEVMPLL
jgi:hypothetical protein